MAHRIVKTVGSPDAGGVNLDGIRRMTESARKPVLFSSVPKCGTHLLLNYFPAAGFEFAGPFGEILWDERFIEYVSKVQSGQHVAWHYHWTPELSALVRQRDVRVVFLYRDPRACVVSNMHFIMKTPEHPSHRYFTEHLKTNEARLIRLIEGIPDKDFEIYFNESTARPQPGAFALRSKLRRGVNTVYGMFAGWLEDPQSLPVRFEDVVGPRGGGDRSVQLETIRRIMDFTGVDPAEVSPETLADALYKEGSPTFRRGRIDSWREDFTESVEAAFVQESGILLDLYRYAS